MFIFVDDRNCYFQTLNPFQFDCCVGHFPFDFCSSLNHLVPGYRVVYWGGPDENNELPLNIRVLTCQGVAVSQMI